ncbi:hypothetical protein ACWD00_38870 [Streptomyces viridiviolaceus]
MDGRTDGPLTHRVCQLDDGVLELDARHLGDLAVRGVRVERRLDYDDRLFTAAPEIENGRLAVPSGPGWGIEPIEDEIRKRPAFTRSIYLGIER